jgi:hypothetical protein
LLPPGDRRPYFSQERSDRLKEWLNYKVSLVLPIDRDVSTRLFDALYAGQTILAPRALDDLDEIIPPLDQAALGIFRLEEMTLAAVREAHAQAEAFFDEAGFAGAMARHAYAKERHMLVHRLDGGVRAAYMFQAGALQPRFVVSPGASGLRFAY